MVIQKNIKTFCRMIKIEHSLFALPFAYAGAVLGAKGWFGFSTFFWLSLGMVSIRSLAMAYNRIADLKYDCQNPRTQKRPLVTGALSVQTAYIFCGIAATIFIVSAFMLGNLCFLLAFPVLFLIILYSYAKRYTYLCHFFLGLILALAPLAGWLCAGYSQDLDLITKISARGFNDFMLSSNFLAVLSLSLAVIFWVAGFDIIYACQDIAFDKKFNLQAVPACFGLKTALFLSGFCHLNTVLFLFFLPILANISVYFYIFWFIVLLLLLFEHLLVSTQNLSRINIAFFYTNVLISVLIFLGIVSNFS